MNHFYRLPRRGRVVVCVSSLLLLLAFALVPAAPAVAHLAAVPVRDDQAQELQSAAAVDWLEPRGLSIATLVGLIPEDHLRNAIVAYRPGYGLVQYVSGKRDGNTVTINVKLTPRYLTFGADVMTRVGCLGQMGVYDEWMGAVQASHMRVFAGGNEITSKAVYAEYAYAGQKKPDEDVSNYFRYDMYKGNPTFAGNGALEVPANMGCTYVFSGRHANLTATFTMQDSSPIQVEPLGNETFTFHSYIGVGNAGQLDSLREQMQRRFGSRHEKFSLSPPAGADYFLVTYPPTPVEPYPDTMEEDNVPLAASGTYRIGREDNTLSVDHTASMAMPLHGQWQDADQSGGDFLNFFGDGTRLAAPEYFVPAGVGYNSCMRSGGCSDALLDQIFNTGMKMTIHYYRITRTADGLTRIPLRQVGTSWKGFAAQSAGVQSDAMSHAAELVDAMQTMQVQVEAARKKRGRDEVVFLPIVRYPVQPTPVPTPQIPPDDASGCPCGWFDSIGRMFDFIPPQ
ncbi:MAG: hypothetical protein KDE53_16945 [Caldilineaceae bacterium]|nr:hypothetical protein [Caldilineaceae bacterium]